MGLELNHVTERGPRSAGRVMTKSVSEIEYVQIRLKIQSNGHHIHFYANVVSSLYQNALVCQNNIVCFDNI